MTESNPKDRSAPLWEARMAEPPDPGFFAFQRSLPYDARLLREDLAVNAAWARALGRAGLFEADEVKRLELALSEIRKNLTPEAAASRDAEDVHTLVEHELTARLGELGRRIHRGKSRNDQVATDLRLWVAAACGTLATEVKGLASALGARAKLWLEQGIVIPGYTHLQQAEPVLAAHWALSHAEPCLRDLRRLAQVKEAALASCPLGSAALSGTPVPIDRTALALDLGFAAPSANSMDAVSDRDFALGFLHATGLFALHASRLGEDLVLFASREFGTARLPGGFTTGSSALPQKRNPDACELARAKAGRVLGRYAALFTTLKGLPTGYNRDLQEDKEGVFDAYDSAMGVAHALAGTVRGMEMDEARARSGLGEWLLAAELAERLSARGLPFRDAYAAVARGVQALEAQGGGRSLESLSADEWRTLDPAFTPEAVRNLSLATALARRQAEGGTAPDRVREAIDSLEARLRP